MIKISKQSPITFVELPPTVFGVLNGDLGSDIYNIVKLPSRGIPGLLGALKKDGWSNVQEINPRYHGKNGKLTSENFKRIFDSDVLLLSSITRTAPSSMELADLYKTNNPEGIVIAGGSDPTFRVSDWLEHVDIVVRGEGEKTISELMNKLRSNKRNLKEIKGISYKQKGIIKNNPKRDLLTNEELNNLPLPIYDSKTRIGVTTSVIETSRGCPYDCEFCSVSEFYGRGYRVKSIDKVLKELKNIENMGNKLGYTNNIFFVDDNLAAQPNRTIELLKQIKKYGIKKPIVAQVTVQSAFNKELMGAFKDANIRTLCVGIESIDDKTLESYNKPFNAEKNKKAVKLFKKYGFWVHGMMILGGDGDTYESILKTRDWSISNLDSVQFFVPTPLPGTRFFKRMKEEARILTMDWSLYDCQHVVIRPKNISPYKLQKTIYEIYDDFYSFKAGFKRCFRSPKITQTILHALFAKIKGSNNIIYNSHSKRHLEFLKSVS